MLRYETRSSILRAMSTRDTNVSPQRINIVVKFSDDKDIPHNRDDSSDDAYATIPEWHQREWEALRREIPGQWRARSLFNSVSQVEIQALTAVAQARAERANRHYSPPKFENYVRLSYDARATHPDERDSEMAQVAEYVMKNFSQWDDVEQCYQRLQDVDAGLQPAVQPVKFDRPDMDPSHVKQAHLLDAPLGVGAQRLWSYLGADGAGQRFIDIERGWQLHNKDLCDADGQPRVRFVSGHGVISTERENVWHGTCVLGVVCATHNRIDIIGMAPRLASMEAISYVDPDDIASTASAVMRAAARQIRIDVRRQLPARPLSVRSNVLILIEAQAMLPNQRFYFPVEVYPDTFDVIRLATEAGITVIEPAGNGRIPDEVVDPHNRHAVDLDRLDEYVSTSLGWKKPLRSLRRSTQPLANVETEPAPNSHTGRVTLAPFADSGAIMVAGAGHALNASGVPDQGVRWQRSRTSNYGSRIDCFAEGESVFTLDANDRGRTEFGGTSAASAVVAGAALCLQGVAQANLGRTFDPGQLRTALSDPDFGTASGAGTADKIGVMPDLVRVAATYVK